MTEKTFKYKLYDSEWNSTRYMEKPYMTVEEFKVKEGYKTGAWIHHNNEFHKQTYSVSIMEKYNNAGFSWRKLKDNETIDFVVCPLIRVDLISPL